VAVSPLSVSITFAAIRTGDVPYEVAQEINSAFGWERAGSLAIPARMLLTALEPPKPATKQTPTPRLVGVPPEVVEQQRKLQSPEEVFVSNRLLFLNKDPLSHQKLNPFAPEFVATAAQSFGMKFVETGAAPPGPRDLQRADKSITAIPDVSENSVWISSNTHLRTAWSHNTFSLSKAFTGDFRTASGETRHVEMITSTLAGYAHATTDSFEAVVLPCQSAHMIVVLPGPGKDIHELERELAKSPNALDVAWKNEPGLITMPPFHIVSEHNLRPKLEEMGIVLPFRNLGNLIRIPKSHLADVAQSIDFQADREGIRASAETVTTAIYSGMMGGQPFQMSLDRPFLFFVRDNNANALLFLGAVMDPGQKD
jgi:Serpin (serine protease inhibitor)